MRTARRSLLVASGSPCPNLSFVCLSCRSLICKWARRGLSPPPIWVTYRCRRFQKESYPFKASHRGRSWSWGNRISELPDPIQNQNLPLWYNSNDSCLNTRRPLTATSTTPDGRCSLSSIYTGRETYLPSPEVHTCPRIQGIYTRSCIRGPGCSLSSLLLFFQGFQSRRPRITNLKSNIDQLLIISRHRHFCWIRVTVRSDETNAKRVRLSSTHQTTFSRLEVSSNHLLA